MKRFPLLVLVLLVAIVAALPAAAQEGHWLGVKAGYGWPSPSVSTDLQILKGTDDSGGFVGGLSWEGGLWKGWSLEGEVLYVQRKATNTYFGGTNVHGTYLGDVTAEYTFTTLEIPFHARYRLSQGATAAFLLGGFVTAIPLDIESTNRANGQSATEDAKNQFDKAWFALEVGAGIDHKLGNGVGLQLDVRYVYGLTNTAAVEGDTWKWRDVRVLAGVKFDL